MPADTRASSRSKSQSSGGERSKTPATPTRPAVGSAEDLRTPPQTTQLGEPTTIRRNRSQLDDIERIPMQNMAAESQPSSPPPPITPEYDIPASVKEFREDLAFYGTKITTILTDSEAFP